MRPPQTFHWGACEFDVDAAIELAGSLTVGRLPVANWTGLMGFIRVDREYAVSKADITIPVIVATMPEDYGPLIIDGWHRLYRAHAEGLETIPAVLLDVKQTKSILLHWQGKKVKRAKHRNPV